MMLRQTFTEVAAGNLSYNFDSIFLNIFLNLFPADVLRQKENVNIDRNFEHLICGWAAAENNKNL
jgi:hypothetical protein